MGAFLVATHPAMGHINPLLAIARELRRRGHTVVFALSAPAKAARVVAAAGFHVAAVRPSLQSLSLLFLPLTSGFTETAFAIRSMSRGTGHYAKAIGRVIDELSPQVVVADFSFPGAYLAAESRRVPYAVVYHVGLSFRGPGVPPFGSGLPIGEDWGAVGERYRAKVDAVEHDVAATIARAGRKLGLREAQRPPSSLSVPASPWLNLVLSDEACEAPRDPLPDTTFFVGPCVGAADTGAAGFHFDRLSVALPKVYASLGTAFNNKPGVFRRIIAAFADGRRQLIVSAGRAYRSIRATTLPSNVMLVEYAPQVALLPRIDAVISHGGNNTVNETLMAGKPLLVMPVGGEQGDNASRVVYLGAGLRADLRTAMPEEIRAKVDRLLEEPAFRRRAEAIAGALAQTDGPGTASRLLERLAATRTPVRRPAGCPLTITRDVPPP